MYAGLHMHWWCLLNNSSACTCCGTADTRPCIITCGELYVVYVVLNAHYQVTCLGLVCIQREVDARSGQERLHLEGVLHVRPWWLYRLALFVPYDVPIKVRMVAPDGCACHVMNSAVINQERARHSFGCRRACWWMCSPAVALRGAWRSHPLWRDGGYPVIPSLTEVAASTRVVPRISSSLANMPDALFATFRSH